MAVFPICHLENYMEPRFLLTCTPPFLFSGDPPTDCAEDTRKSAQHIPILSVAISPPKRPRSLTAKKLWSAIAYPADRIHPTMCEQCERFIKVHNSFESLLNPSSLHHFLSFENGIVMDHSTNERLRRPFQVSES